MSEPICVTVWNEFWHENPQRHADVVELEVEGIGKLRNTLGPKENVDPDYRYKPTQ